jgi:hypothetical protein
VYRRESNPNTIGGIKISHITTCKTTTHFINEEHLFNALAELRKQYPGLTYEMSANRKLIQVHYAPIDDPVRSYHKEGNLRLNKLNTGEWKMSGDTYGCWSEDRKTNLYTEITKRVEVNYVKSKYNQFCRDEGYVLSNVQETEKTVVMVAQRG